MSTYRNLITLCAAAVLTLGLAACGGGGSSPATDGTDMMEPTPQEQIAALQQQINALRAELGLDPIDIDDLTGSVADLTQQVADLQKQIDDAADAEADRMAAEARATAAKLYAGISAPMGDVTSLAANDRAAAYNADATAVLVSNSGDTPLTAAITLSENKKAMVDDNHGWMGKMYMDPAGGDSYEAVVYSNVEAPKMGRKFGSAAAVTPTGAYEYQLANGALAIDTSGTATPASRVASPQFDHSAGTKTFKLPDPNPGGATNILIPGSFHGVSGTYSCAPSTPADGCSATVAALGFTLGAGTWTFTPSDANARVMSAPDSDYASYGWWLHKSENGMTFTASAFTDEKGTVAAASGLDALNGTAEYVGGAAGKYALASSTGGTNDAGHFTARATLEANFTTNTAATAITGTLDMFMGADGMARDWSVKLNGSDIGDDGGIGNAGDGTDNVATVWTIGENAAAPSGQWTGMLRNNGTDGVPKVATGTFYTEYGTAGRMVGGFGATKQ